MVKEEGVNKVKGMRLQHEVFNLKDDETVEIPTELTEEILSLIRLNVPTGEGLWSVIRSHIEKSKHDHIQHYFGYLVGSRTTQQFLCSAPCYLCDHKEKCPLHQEIKFMGEVYTGQRRKETGLIPDV